MTDCQAIIYRLHDGISRFLFELGLVIYRSHPGSLFYYFIPILAGPSGKQAHLSSTHLIKKIDIETKIIKGQPMQMTSRSMSL